MGQDHLRRRKCIYFHNAALEVSIISNEIVALRKFWPNVVKLFQIFQASVMEVSPLPNLMAQLIVWEQFPRRTSLLQNILACLSRTCPAMLSKCDCLVFCIVNTLNGEWCYKRAQRKSTFISCWQTRRMGGKDLTREDFSSVFGWVDGENLASKD